MPLEDVGFAGMGGDERRRVGGNALILAGESFVSGTGRHGVAEWEERVCRRLSAGWCRLLGVFKFVEKRTQWY